MAAPLPSTVVNGAGVVGTTSTVSAPATRAAGKDILLAFLYFYKTTGTITTPGGWTIIPPSPTIGTTLQIGSYIRVASNTAADDFSVTLPSSAYAASDMIKVIGAKAITTVDATDADNSGTSTAPKNLTLTTTGVDRLLVAVTGPDSASVYTPPSGFTSWSLLNGCAVATSTQAAAGASGDKTGGLEFSMPWATHMFALAPSTSLPDLGRTIRNSLRRR